MSLRSSAGGTVLVIDHDVDVAVVVEIAEGDAAADVIGIEVGSGIAGGQLETLSLAVAVQQVRAGRMGC